ncbi:MAG: substrate-binding domain-containing protein [Bifidobacteriaceae bacterium]|nr:substrate-binding domain-containing protein [Bifidobacteriaceae bacterium]
MTATHSLLCVGAPRRFLAVILALCVCTGLLAGCGASVAAESGLRVGFVGVGSTEGNSTAVMEKKAVAGLRAAGMTVTYRPSATADPMRQINAADALLEQDPSVLVVNMRYINLWTDTLLKFKAAGIPVVLLGSKPIGLKATMYDAYLGPSAHDIGTQLGTWVRHAAATAQQKLRVLTVTTPLDSVTSSDIDFGRDQAMAPDASHIADTTIVGSWNSDATRASVARRLDASGTSATKLPQVMIGYSAAATDAILTELAKRGIPTSSTVTKGAVCVLGVHGGSGDMALSVMWDADYSKQLARIVQKLGNGQAIVKDNLVALQVK